MDSFNGKYSNIDVGSLMNKDHSTVINGQKVHSEMYETNYEKTYRAYYDKIYEEFMSKLSIESIEEFDPQKKSMFQVINEINKIEISLKKVKDVLIKSYLEGFELNEEVRNELKSIL
jgi:Asp-tRNA(Asn)/Glu-tRNA(Gln) amidotransferase B subunit